MALFDFLKGGSDQRGKDLVKGTRVLVCAFEAEFDLLLHADAEIYRRSYGATETSIFTGPEDMFLSLKKGYDVVHLFCNLTPDGLISRSQVSGTEVIEKCCSLDVKLLWIANDNDPKAYIAGFKARGKRINLVMTIHREETKFPRFLQSFLSFMSTGDTMPIAWSKLCPQIPDSSHSDAPETIFYAGRGGVQFQ